MVSKAELVEISQYFTIQKWQQRLRQIFAYQVNYFNVVKTKDFFYCDFFSQRNTSQINIP